MPYGQYLIKNRHGTCYYARILIPPDIRSLIGNRREFRRSLRTSDKRLAKRRAAEIWIQCQHLFEQLRAVSVSGKTKTYKVELMTFTGINGRTIEIDYGCPERESAECQRLEKREDDFIRNNPALALQMIQARTTATPASLPAQMDSPSFCEVAESYLSHYRLKGETGKKPSPSTLNKRSEKVMFWAAYFSDRAIHSITKQEAGEAEEVIYNFPSNYSKKGLTFQDAIDLAKTRHDLPTLSKHKTAPDYLATLYSIFAFAKKKGHRADNPAEDVDRRQSRSEQKECRPFTLDDLKAIFPGADYGQHFGKAKDPRTLPAKFWIPLMGAFIGARVEELAQLTTRDVMRCPETGIDYLMITNEGKASDGNNKTLKNRNSKRPIPIHPQLIEIGFLDFVQERRSSGPGDVGLFELTRSGGRLSKPISGWFSRYENKNDGTIARGYIERQGVDSKGGSGDQRWSKSFHSFRHTVCDRLRAARKPDHEIALLTGHSPTHLETRNYGNGVEARTLEERRDICYAVEFNDVPFDQIRWRTFKQRIELG